MLQGYAVSGAADGEKLGPLFLMKSPHDRSLCTPLCFSGAPYSIEGRETVYLPLDAALCRSAEKIALLQGRTPPVLQQLCNAQQRRRKLARVAKLTLSTCLCVCACYMIARR
uniref:Uncharacterized protein n=1 Tax=Prymnesium polylepis TaxID=72548 RepID=A0A6T7WK13_9EUKA|mmetsp:Transcript_12664/g.32122  ORF Transcript_12664/g.32122 Transcript_12664/m.32122 type:complete len:112 (+) Transcript_12664:632-967(+)